MHSKNTNKLTTKHVTTNDFKKHRASVYHLKFYFILQDMKNKMPHAAAEGSVSSYLLSHETSSRKRPNENAAGLWPTSAPQTESFAHLQYRH